MEKAVSCEEFNILREYLKTKPKDPARTPPRRTESQPPKPGKPSNSGNRLQPTSTSPDVPGILPKPPNTASPCLSPDWKAHDFVGDHPGISADRPRKNETANSAGKTKTAAVSVKFRRSQKILEPGILR